MFVTRATRHDRSDLEHFYAASEWEADPSRGTSFFARDGGIVGAARLVEVGPQMVVVDDVVVDRNRRNQGIGSAVMRAAMNSRGGRLFLCCHPEALGFYEKLGFAQVDFASLPDEVAAYFREVGDFPTAADHVHLFLRAR